MTLSDADKEAWVEMWLEMQRLHGLPWVLHWAAIVQYCKGQLSDGTVSS